ncbi:nitroreductase family protein [Dyadobacter sandarakinus]|uniref:Putative NAD(P)H nitroreductase n=1 Tax=Dyadobacter sandarakinus TaxID=2747268 RepID=A0ABX7IE65_9BACT|nr:nitroreductase [Dyadobacter sandarakinus]QRR03817.1 nitroreductase [Dyadobacter sandarakinus]
MEQSIETINRVIRTRRSIFPPSYIEKDIPDEIIHTILENANFAPSHKLTEPWRFVVFKGESKKRLAGFFSERYRSQTPAESFSQARYDAAGEKVLKSNCVIVINAELHPDKLPEWEETAAVACAVQNMWLTATAYGIGSYWSSPALLEDLARFLELPENQKSMGLYFLGYHDAPELPARRTPIEGKVTWAQA